MVLHSTQSPKTVHHIYHRKEKKDQPSPLHRLFVLQRKVQQNHYSHFSPLNDMIFLEILMISYQLLRLPEKSNLHGACILESQGRLWHVDWRVNLPTNT